MNGRGLYAPGGRLYIAPAIRTTRSGMAPRSTTGLDVVKQRSRNLVRQVTVVWNDGCRSANSGRSCAKKLKPGMTWSRDGADVARRRSRSEEIYKAAAQRVGTPARMK